MWESTGTTCDQVNRRHNVWLGTSIACQDDAERNIPHLLRCGETVPVLFLSIEPLVGPVELAKWLGGRSCRGHGDDPDSLEQCETGCDYDPPDFDFVTVGGESGPNARPCRVEWIRDIVRQCREAGVPCFVKQLGANVIDDSGESRCSWPGLTKFQWDRVLLRDPKGGDPSEWPEDLKVREVPSTVC
jgi:protein gp37